MDELQLVRERYVEELRYKAHLRSDAVIRAFAEVERERFLGPGPWQIMNFDGSYWGTPDANPRHIYHDVLVAIHPDRKLNNGQPSALAHLIEALELQRGAHVVHLGCGTGYYTAIMANVVGEAGRVTAVELDANLAVKAAENLSELKQVTVVSADASLYEFDDADGILVNAGATHPVSVWLDRLRLGGTLLLPLTFASGSGGFFKITRSEIGFAARFVMGTVIFHCVGARDPDEEKSLQQSFLAGNLDSIRSLRMDSHPTGSSCWFHTETFCFSKDEQS